MQKVKKWSDDYTLKRLCDYRPPNNRGASKFVMDICPESWQIKTIEMTVRYRKVMYHLRPRDCVTYSTSEYARILLGLETYIKVSDSDGSPIALMLYGKTDYDLFAKIDEIYMIKGYELI